MSFKWNVKSVTVACPCGKNTEEYSVDNIDVETYSEDNSDSKMGATYRHIASIDYHCSVCDKNFESNVEFMEYPEGQCECVNVEGDLLARYDEDNLKDLVDFSLDE